MLFFLDTKLGQAYIATGDNPDMARSFGINTGRMELMGLVLSNGIIALAGALIAQQEGYADVSRGKQRRGDEHNHDQQAVSLNGLVTISKVGR